MCGLDQSPTICSGWTYGAAGQRSTWEVTGCSGGSLGVTSLSGESLCSDTVDTNKRLGSPSNTLGRNCWCKITSVNGDAVSGFWAYSGWTGSGDMCADACSSNCGVTFVTQNILADEYVKQALFTGFGTTPAPVQPTNPMSCGSYSYGGRYAESSWEVTGCTGSDVTYFTGFSRWCRRAGGPRGPPGNPAANVGTHCWCKITSVKPNGAAGSSWLYYSNYPNASVCADNCAGQCGADAKDIGTFRSGLFSTLKTKGYACVSNPSPTSCGNYTTGAQVQKSTWAVTGCSGGGLGVTDYLGESLCSSTPGGSEGAPGNPSDNDGTNCWCRITGLNPGGAVSGRWVHASGHMSASICASDCKINCGTSHTRSTLRSALFNAIDW
jgi:hypothetical protein